MATAPSVTTEPAQTIAAVLAQSAVARSDAAQGVQDVEACHASAGATKLDDAYQDRETELTQAQNLDASTLTNGTAVRAALIKLLQDSATADHSYGLWARDLESSCSTPLPSDRNRASGDRYSQRCDTDKGRFITLWRPLAEAHSLPVYSATTI
jgi:hypothetical protein